MSPSDRVLSVMESCWGAGWDNNDFLRETVAVRFTEALEQVAADTRERAASEAERRGKRNQGCAPGCKCADPWHIANAIRAI